MFLWAQQDRHTTRQTHSWPWHVDLIHGARDSGGRRAWVSTDPAGLSQRRSGGHWVRGGPAWSPANGGPGGAANGGPGGAANGGVISRERRAANGGVISRERRVWGSGNPGTRQPAGGLGRATAGRISPAIGRHEGSRPVDSRHSRRSRRTPTPTWRGLGQDDERRLPCRGTNRQNSGTNKNFSKNEQNKTGWMGAAYGLGLVFCHGAHTREDTGTRRWGLKLK